MLRRDRTRQRSIREGLKEKIRYEGKAREGEGMGASSEPALT